MADVEVIIKIPEKSYRAACKGCMLAPDVGNVVQGIKNGTLLPKGHGRIGDLDFLAKRIKCKPPIGEIGKVTLDECYQEVLSAEPIIEANKEN